MFDIQGDKDRITIFVNLLYSAVYLVFFVFLFLLLVVSLSMNSFVTEFTASEVDTLVANDIDECNECMSVKDGLNVFHTNIRSVAKNLDELQVFLNQFVHSFQIVVLTETFQVEDTKPYKLDGYDLLYSEGKINSHDGVFVYIAKTIKYKYKIVSLGEVKCIQVGFSFNRKKICLTAVYRPNPSCPKLFNTYLHSYLETIEGNVDYSMLIGDININILSQKDFAQEYLNILSEMSYISQVNKFTRIDGQKRSCIDHIFIRDNTTHESDIVPIILQDKITDHYPIIVQFNGGAESRTENEAPTSKTFINYYKLNTMLGHERWQMVYDGTDVDDMTEHFTATLTNAIKHCSHTVSIKKNSLGRKSWVTKGLLTSIKVKNRLYKQIKKDPSDTQAIERYRLYKNKLEKLIRSTKYAYIQSEICKNSNNVKNLYKVVRDLCGTRGKGNSGSVCGNTGPIEEVRLLDGTISRDKQAISDSFNDHYTTYGQRLADKIKNPSKITPVKHQPNSFFMKPTSESEIVSVINSLKNGTSPGYDKLKAETLKRISEVIKQPLTFLVNKIMEQGGWPKLFKRGVVRPLFKSGNRREIVNYRPITLISNLAKIAEKIIKVRMTGFIDRYCLLADSQFGFRPGKSTQDAFENLLGNVYSAVDNNQPALCIFVDLAKAFDTVNHEILLDKLQRLGFRGNTYDLLKSYLCMRTQQVIFNNYLSRESHITCGVPQGTVLGPVLFALYINDLLTMSGCGKIVSFADDTAIFYKSHSWEALKMDVERDFSRVVEWFDSNLLTVNMDKTKFLTFTSYQQNLIIKELTIATNNKNLKIKESVSVKYLGITLDKNLKWNLHTDTLVKKLRTFISKFKYLVGILSSRQLKILYHSFIESQLSYGIIAWGSLHKCYLKNLETVQKWILKVIHQKKKNYPSDDLFKEAMVLDIRQLYSLNVLLRQPRHDYISFLDHHYSTRNKFNICRKAKCRKAIGQRSYIYQGQKLYDVLPPSIKEIANSYSYKRKVKQWLFDTSRKVIADILQV